MKIVCSVKVNHRLLPSYNLPRRRAQRCSLTLWKKPGGNDVFLTLQSLGDKIGTKYKVKENLERVFDKYVHEGKASIIFKDPPHELLISCDTQSLTKFLQTMKLTLQAKVPLKMVTLSSPQPVKKIPPKSPTSVIISRKEDYPFLSGFPETLVHVSINGVQQSKFDMRLLGLPKLQFLDLSDNNLESIPEAVNLLTSLKSLILQKNKLYMCHNWQWMWSENLSKSLEVLDLSNNKLLQLPTCVRRLSSLRVLKLANNYLCKLPPCIGKLRNLRNLSVACNTLEYVPGSFAHLNLIELDIADNNFNLFDAACLQGVVRYPSGSPTLKEIAARSVVDNRVPFGKYDLPRTLQVYLDNVQFCMCGHACFEWYAYVFKLFTPSLIAQTVIRTFGRDCHVHIRLTLCSWNCFHSVPKY